jgi:tetratricopeptide (TPR) repeat protein
MLMNRMHIRVTSAALTALLLVSIEAHAFNFTPTDAEWATWPEMCKARYSRTRIGTGSDFGTSVPQSVVQQWEAQLGPGWHYVHHHCAGMIYLDRAKLESNASQRKFLLGRSIAEHSFALEHTPADNPLAAEIRTRLGLTYREGGDHLKAREQFVAALKVNATYGSAYVGLALLDRDENHADAAITTLRKGNEVTSGQSAEISHFLSLLLLQQGHYEESRTFARQAYANGYPLPGLRDRLARAGYPLD